MTAQLSIVEAGPVPAPELAQYNTDPRLAKALVDLVRPMLLDARRRGFVLRVLEPSAGRGNLIRALRDVAGDLVHVDAVELDGRWHDDLIAAGASRVHIGSYLDRPAPASLYDLVLSNPPFTDGEETDHLAKIKGTFTLELAFNVEPHGYVEVSPKIKTKMAERRRGKGVMWITPGGNLSEKNPRQQDLPLHDVGGRGDARDVGASKRVEEV